MNQGKKANLSKIPLAASADLCLSRHKPPPSGTLGPEMELSSHSLAPVARQT
jgi:hypothetical protein